MGPRACLDRSGKPLSLEFDPRTIQPAASRYTDYALPATKVSVGLHVKFPLYLSVYRKFKLLETRKISSIKFHGLSFGGFLVIIPVQGEGRSSRV